MLKFFGSKLRNTMVAAAGAAAAFCAGPVLAGSVTQPGETIGLAAGAPLPEGFYFVDTFDWGVRKGHGSNSDVTLGVNIPVLAWSTPATLAGGRLQLLAAVPELQVGIDSTYHKSAMYNPFLAGQLAWDLGGGLGVSYLLGVYAPVRNGLGFDTTSINQRVGISYTADGWNLTGNFIYGINTRKASRTLNPNFLNIDVTAAKSFGKWQLGPVAFASFDTSKPTATYKKQEQVALGAMVGYGFSDLILQGYLTRTVSESNYGGNDTRAWGRIILPF